jgi:hypothetical protein
MAPSRGKFKPFFAARRGASGPDGPAILPARETVGFLQRLANISDPPQWRAIFRFECRQLTTIRGRGHMSIDTLLLILLLAFGLGFVVDRLELGRKPTRRIS